MPDVLCNLCGLSCVLGNGDCAEFGGLIEETVEGGYASTAGNGCGALDDTMEYKFSLCEFCLDWLFARFVVPVSTVDVYGGSSEKWRPAAERVAADSWRRMKKRFTDEAARRAAARMQGTGEVK